VVTDSARNLGRDHEGQWCKPESTGGTLPLSTWDGGLREMGRWRAVKDRP